jgi:hypothetical protein
MDSIMQGLRHHNPSFCTYVSIKKKHEPVDLKFLSINMLSISKQLHKMGLVLGHHMTTLS